MSTNSKLEKVDNTEVAIQAITSAMKRKGLSLADICRAIDTLADRSLVDAVIKLREDGNSIHKIARTVHVDDSRVSKILKENISKCKGCKKPCTVKCCGTKDKKAAKSNSK